MARNRIVLLVAVGIALLSCGCSTFYSTAYYKFSGRVVDARTGVPLPHAAIYIAESKKDLFRTPRAYQDEVPWYVKGPVYVDTSGLVFGRRAQNRYLFLMADDSGKFTTVWRHDVVQSGIFPFNLLKSRKLKNIAFAVGAPGHSDRIVAFDKTSEQKAFAASENILGMPDNALPAVRLTTENANGLSPGPILTAYLRVHYPPAPRGDALVFFEQAEKAFSQGQFGPALNLYDKALKNAPNQPLVLLMKMDTLYRIGQYEDVLAAGRSYIRLYPDVGFAHKIVADAAYKLGELDLSKQENVLAMQLDPEFPSAYLSLILQDPSYARLPVHWLAPSEIWIP